MAKPYMNVHHHTKHSTLFTESPFALLKVSDIFNRLLNVVGSLLYCSCHLPFASHSHISRFSFATVRQVQHLAMFRFIFVLAIAAFMITTVEGRGGKSSKGSPSSTPKPSCLCEDPEFFVSGTIQTFDFHLYNARGMGCELASIRSPEENAAALAAFQSALGPTGNLFAWIGGLRRAVDLTYDPFAAGGWQWTDGSSWPQTAADGYTNWSKYFQQPNNGDKPAAGVTIANSDILMNNQFAGDWFDAETSEKYYGLYKCCTIQDSQYQFCEITSS